MGLFVCNVEPWPDFYREVKTLPKWISVFERLPKWISVFERLYIGKYSDIIFEKEKQDYVFCLEKSLALNVSHVLLVEDDAIPLQDLFPVIDLLVFSNSSSFDSQSSKEATYYKLYHLERLLGFISLE